MNAVLENKQPIWINQLEKLINKALSLDEETLEALGQLEGKMIAFEFIKMQLTLYLSPTSEGLTIQTGLDSKPDVLIKGTPSNFIKMMAASKRGPNAMPSDMQLIGDIGLAQSFQGIMQNIEIDLEEPLSKWVGDTMAYKIGKFVKDSSRFAFKTGKTLATDVSEYLRFEIEMLPDDLLVDEFCKDVDVLREDVDRLTQRINKLEISLHKKEK